MMTSATAWMGLAYGLSELGLSLLKRASRSGDAADGGSLRRLWITIVCSLALASVVPGVLPQANFSTDGGLYALGVVLYAAGLLLRWTSILWLGKFFTVNVAIASDHIVVDTGPYRFIRHPSYTGALAAFLGFGLCIGNWVSLLVMMIPVTWAFMERVRLEESVLRGALGAAYIDYSRRTKRLIPFIY
jgi:protein-S-isoprenylcysteine O-methyltransferase Ste14